MLPTGNSIELLVLIASAAPVVCTLLPILIVSVPASTNKMLAVVSPFTAKFTSASAELMFTTPLVSVISSPEITMLPNLPDVAIALPASIFPVAETYPPVSTLPPVTLPVALTVVASTLPMNVTPVTLPPALTVPPVATLPPVTVPVALTTPVTYSPVVVHTITLLVPPIVTLALPFGAVVTLVLPFTNAIALVANTPVSCEPLPKK